MQSAEGYVGMITYDGELLRAMIDALEITEFPACEDDANEFIEVLRWPVANRITCPHCGAVGHAGFLIPRHGARFTSSGKETNRYVFKCYRCRRQFSVRTGTFMERSHIPVTKWLQAICFLKYHEWRVTTQELADHLNISYRAAWSLRRRVLMAWQQTQENGNDQ